MNEILTKETQNIDLSECDYRGHYRLHHLFNHFTKIATKDASQRMMWQKNMNGHYGWVVTKQSLHLNQPISMNDIITVSTTVSTGSHVAFPRYYWIEKDNQIIGECSSLWTLIDLDKRRITSPKRIGLNMNEVKCKQPLPSPKTIHLPSNMQYTSRRQVLYSDVDINQHMNNSRYIEWAIDLIDYSIHKHYYIEELSINYKKEITPLTYIDLYLKQIDTTFYIEGKSEETSFFAIEIKFKQES